MVLSKNSPTCRMDPPKRERCLLRASVIRYYRKPTPQTSRPAALFPRCVIRPARPSHMSEREFPHSLLVRRGFRSSYSVVLLSVANFRVADQPPLGGLPRRRSEEHTSELPSLRH